jgi:hypothetical protein
VLYLPFLMKTKADIAYRALELGVPFHWTWSCYKGGEKHCGRCGTCVERLEAIDEACKRAVKATFQIDPEKVNYMALNDQKVDQTEYEDAEFWKTAVEEAKAK